MSTVTEIAPSPFSTKTSPNAAASLSRETLKQQVEMLAEFLQNGSLKDKAALVSLLGVDRKVASRTTSMESSSSYCTSSTCDSHPPGEVRQLSRTESLASPIKTTSPDCSVCGSPPPLRTYNQGNLTTAASFQSSVLNLLGSQPKCGSVEEMFEAVKKLPRHVSAVEAIGSSLPLMDSQAFAALLKMLGKAPAARTVATSVSDAENIRRASGAGPTLAYRAFELFDWVAKLAEAGVEACKELCGIYTYTTMISLSFGSRENCRQGLKYFAQMRAAGITGNTFTYTALMSIFLKVNEVDAALDVYKDFKKLNLVPTMVTYKILLDVFGRAGLWDDALEVFANMEAKGFKPDVRTYTLVFMCLARSKAPPKQAVAVTQMLYECLLASELQPKPATHTQLMKVFGRAGQLEAVLYFYNLIPHSKRNVATYFNLAEAYAVDGNMKEAERIIKSMQPPPVVPDQCKSGTCTCWDGHDCFFLNVYGFCKYGHTHIPNVSNRTRHRQAL